MCYNSASAFVPAVLKCRSNTSADSGAYPVRYGNLGRKEALTAKQECGDDAGCNDRCSRKRNAEYNARMLLVQTARYYNYDFKKVR